jgi:acyl homoserine lactone synthase
MRILTVSHDHYERHRDFLRQMHRLRATVFGGRLAWDVSITAGEERDQYDDCRPTYLLAVADGGNVAGCVRLLPASGPTMLEQTFLQLLDTGSLRPRSGMVESSHFCVDTSLISQREARQCGRI